MIFLSCSVVHSVRALNRLTFSHRGNNKNEVQFMELYFSPVRTAVNHVSRLLNSVLMAGAVIDQRRLAQCHPRRSLVESRHRRVYVSSSFVRRRARYRQQGHCDCGPIKTTLADQLQCSTANFYLWYVLT